MGAIAGTPRSYRGIAARHYGGHTAVSSGTIFPIFLFATNSQILFSFLPAHSS
jgi:predicted acyltransferase